MNARSTTATFAFTPTLLLALLAGGCSSTVARHDDPIGNSTAITYAAPVPASSTPAPANYSTNYSTNSSSNGQTFASNSAQPYSQSQDQPQWQPLPGDAFWAPVPASPTVTPNDAFAASPAPLSDAAEGAGNGGVEITSNVVCITGAEVGAAFDPSVSPDGKSLIFASTQHRKTSDIYLQRIGSRVVTQLTSDPADDAMPQISPDGTRVAFASNRAGNWDIYIMPVGGGRAVQVTSDVADEIAPTWSPDGTQLVFSRKGQASGRWEMWVTSGRDHATTSFIGFGLFPRWSPMPATGADGADKIAFQVGRERDGRGFAIWTLDYSQGNASNFTQIVSSADEAMINPNWSPDGQWIVYAERPVNGATTNTSLWMVGVDGSGRVRLTGDQSRALSPVWASNNRLYFVSNRSGLDNVWAADLGQAVAAARALTPPDGFVARANPNAASHDPHAPHSDQSEHVATEEVEHMDAAHADANDEH